MSADAFDQGDGSTHKDEDVDYDLIQAEAVRKENEEKQRQYRLTQGRQTVD